MEDIFSIFHDGYIDDFKIESNRIDLKIGTQYLAELIHKQHEYINLSLLGVESINYDAWTDEPFVMTDWKEIFNLGIGILSTETDNEGKLIVHSDCDDAPNDSFQGGKLIIKCSDYKLSDEEGSNLTIEKLKELSSYYWNEKFGK
jgi:hypothetical protein